jgi:hypothetical protein
MPGRTQNLPDYRYGFNGKEKDEDGEMESLTTYDYGFCFVQNKTCSFSLNYELLNNFVYKLSTDPKTWS